MPEPRTLCELFNNSHQERPRKRAYLRKLAGTYQLVSTQEVVDRVQAVAAALRQIGVQPRDRVAILAPNGLEWAVADYAILHCGAVTVPLYPTLQASSVQEMLRDCEAMAVFVADAEQLTKLGAAEDLPHLTHAVVFNGESPSPEPAPCPVSSMQDFEQRGTMAHDAEAFERIWRAVKPEDVATFIYTSGTTGTPKGVMLTHRNIVSNVLAVLRRLPIGPADTCLSFLPLSHIFERMAGHFVMWHAGTCIAFAENVESVPEDLLEVQPTVLVSVPRLYEKMNARVLNAVQSAPPWRQRLFAWAREVGRSRVQIEQSGRRVSPWLSLKSAVADRLVFAKLRERLGGRIRFMISGGAPLTPAIAEFFFAARLPILEGYGLTETSPVICVNPLARPRIGTVGPPIEGVEVRIAENGEILARGPNIMKGYHNKPKETSQVLEEGWFHTGDVGELDANNYLRITDRIKDLIVTAGGKNIAPQPIESRLKSSQYVTEAILVGDRRKYLSALIIPQFQHLKALATKLGLHSDAMQDLLRAPQIMQLFVDFLGELNRDLASYERVKRFCLLDRELQIESGEITPTMKVKRNVIAKTYEALINEMYEDPPASHIGCPSTSDSSLEAAASTPTEN